MLDAPKPEIELIARQMIVRNILYFPAIMPLFITGFFWDLKIIFEVPFSLLLCSRWFWTICVVWGVDSTIKSKMQHIHLQRSMSTTQTENHLKVICPNASADGDGGILSPF